MRLKAALLVAALVLAPALCTAQTSAPDAPTATGETGWFNLLTAETLPQRGWSFSLYYNNFDRLMSLEKIFGDTDDLEFDWDRLSASFAYGITERWEVALQVPFYDDFTFRHDELLLGDDLDVNGPNNIHIGTNFQFFRNETVDSAASINGFVEVPTGDTDVASDQHGFGIKGAFRVRRLAFNFGYRDPGDEDDFDNPQDVFVGGGYGRSVTDRFQWITELIGSFIVGGEEDIIDERRSLDLTSGGRLIFPNAASPWAANFALRINVNGASGVGGVVGITYGRR